MKNVYVNLDGKKWSGLGWGRTLDYYGYILKDIEENYYAHLTYQDIVYYSLDTLKINMPLGANNFIDIDYEETIYRFNDILRFKIYYELDNNKYLVFFIDENNKLITELQKKYLNDDFEKAFDGLYILSNFEKYKNNLEKWKKIYFINEETKDIVQYESDYFILKNLKHPIYVNHLGQLHFKKEILTEKEEKIKKEMIDVSNVFDGLFIENKYTFIDILYYFIHSGYSVDDVLENLGTVFYESNNVLHSQDVIKSIIDGRIIPIQKR